MARPPGIPINAQALNDFMACRHRTLSELAVQAELSLSYLSELANGIGKPSQTALKRIAEALRISPESLERYFVASDIGTILTTDSLAQRCDVGELEDLRDMVTAALDRKRERVA